MFSNELEMLIDAALADGEITEKERAVLHKRAEAEGVDPDELDVLIEARLARLNQSGSMKYNNSNEPRKASITKELMEQLQQAQRKYERRLANVDRSWYDGLATEKEESQIENERDETMGTIIRDFHVPNERDDLLDFLLLCKNSYKVRCEMSKSNYWSIDNSRLKAVDRAYIEKSSDLMGRARSYFPQDKAILEAIVEIEKLEKDFERNENEKKIRDEENARAREEQKRKEKKMQVRKIVWGVIGVIVLLFVLLIILIAIDSI